MKKIFMVDKDALENADKVILTARELNSDGKMKYVVVTLNEFGTDIEISVDLCDEVAPIDAVVIAENVYGSPGGDL